VLFLIGTYLYYPAESASKERAAQLGDDTAWLYVIGSLGFLFVDVQEYFTYTVDASLRTNIAVSISGSSFYVVGSAGFLPAPFAFSPLIGIGGFILGSAFIGCSEIWKLTRIFKTEEGAEKWSQAAVEGGACVGGWMFFFGTVRGCCCCSCCSCSCCCRSC